MRDAWTRTLLGQVVTLQRGFDLPERLRSLGAFPIVSSSGITGHHSEFKVHGPGVVTGRYGTLGEVFYLETDFWPLNTTLWVKDFKGNDPEFTSYLLRTLNLGHQNAAGAVPGLNRNALHLLPVTIPPRLIQKEIAGFLRVYDCLIENNIRRIKILEEMAQMTFREWFVNLRFPGYEEVKLVKSGNGHIPEGWEKCSVTEVIDINPRVKVPKTGVKPFVPMGSLSENCMLVGQVEDRGGNSGSKFQNGDTLFARITPCLENGKTGFVQFLPSSESVGFGSTEFIVLRSRAVCPEYVYLMARSNEFRENAIKSMSGATGRQRVQERCFEKFAVAKPPSETLLRFQNIVGPMFCLIQVMNLENVNLQKSRDFLLPMLMSGEITVEHFETQTASQIS